MARIPATCADIDAAWLNEVLSHDVRGGGTVTAVGVEVIGEGVGFLGEVARLTLSYDATAGGGVASVIAKLPTANAGFRHIGLMFGFYRKEHGFYAEVAQQVQLSIPRAYHNAADVEAGEYVLLLEDMAPRRPGNQLAGCTLEEAELALQEVAGFHATWWEHPKLDEFSTWLPGPDDPYFALLEAVYQDALPKFADAFGYLVGDRIVELAGRYSGMYAEAVQRGVGRLPHTFIHGDFRLDNMMFSGSGDELQFCLLDWQLPFKANPMWDVVYFLAGNFEPQWRRDHQHQLLHRYHDALVAAGVSGYPFEQCEEDYRAAGLVLLGYLVSGAADVDLATLNDRGRELIETMFTRYALAIEDLGSASFLD